MNNARGLIPVLFCWAIFASGPLFADPINQTNAQDAAKKLNDTGADDSIQGAVTNGMRALHSLNELDIPGALKNGVKAYGQYRNSEELDKLKDQNAANSAKMGSGAEKISGKAYASPFARLPKNFLYEGEAGRLAAQIESLSGVSRDELLRKVTKMEGDSKKVPDGQWARWVLNATGEFAESMVNESFRDKLVQAHNLAVKLVDNGTALGILAKFRGGNGDEAKEALVLPKASGVSAPAASAPPANTKPESAAVSAPAPAPAPKPASSLTGASGKMPTSAGGIHQAESRNEFMDKLVNTAVNTKEPVKETDGPTIFDQVTAKIRQVYQRQN